MKSLCLSLILVGLTLVELSSFAQTYRRGEKVTYTDQRGQLVLGFVTKVTDDEITLRQNNAITPEKLGSKTVFPRSSAPSEIHKLTDAIQNPRNCLAPIRPGITFYIGTKSGSPEKAKVLETYSDSTLEYELERKRIGYFPIQGLINLKSSTISAWFTKTEPCTSFTKDGSLCKNDLFIVRRASYDKRDHAKLQLSTHVNLRMEVEDLLSDYYCSKTYIAPKIERTNSESVLNLIEPFNLDERINKTVLSKNSFRAQLMDNFGFNNKTLNEFISKAENESTRGCHHVDKELPLSSMTLIHRQVFCTASEKERENR